MHRALLLIALTGGLVDSACAFDFEPIKPLDVKSVAPDLLANVYGGWEICDKSGKRHCRIKLKQEFGIGGYQIEVAPECEEAFSVMADVSAWRLLQNWTIDLVDPLRKTRLRFETPDNRYVAFGDKAEIAGMDEVVKIQNKPGLGKK